MLIYLRRILKGPATILVSSVIRAPTIFERSKQSSPDRDSGTAIDYVSKSYS